MNAVVQCLSTIDVFSSYLSKLPTVDSKNFVFRRRSAALSPGVGSLSPTPSTTNGTSGVNGGADCRLSLPVLGSQPETRLRRKRDLAQLLPTSSEKDSLVLEELRKVIVELIGTNTKTISPDSLLACVWRIVPSFRGHQQQDAHEFMRFLLDRLHTELAQIQPSSKIKSPYPFSTAISSNDFGSSSPTETTIFGRLTIVAAIFGGLLQSDVACHVCNNVSIKRDPFLDLSLDIPIPKDKIEEANNLTCRLADCFSSFTDLEELSESEHFYCPSCRKRQPSTKKFTIKRLPNVLCVHLKRFWWNGVNRIKLDTFVDCPLRCFDLSKYVISEQRCTRLSMANNDSSYDLSAFIVHHGSGTGSGHFTTFAQRDGEWFHFNDSTVRSASLEDVRSAKAYILFYVRQNIRIPPALLLNSCNEITERLTNGKTQMVNGTPTGRRNRSSSRHSM